MINVTVWNEFIHEREDDAVKEVYPNGIHMCIKDFLGVNEDINVRTATLDEPQNGLTDEILKTTDVLIWWAHIGHDKVLDEVAKKVQNRVLEGMGFIALHSAHFSKPFTALMGTSGSLCWRDDDFERLWNVAPSHPITQGIGDYIELEQEEMYGERFDIPTPDELIFIGWFRGGEVFRSGCCWNRGQGKVFYFQPGHESNPTYYKPEIQRIITNAVRFVAPKNGFWKIECPNAEISPEARIATLKG